MPGITVKKFIYLEFIHKNKQQQTHIQTSVLKVWNKSDTVK